MDRFFRVYGPEEERKLYGLGRLSIERVNSRLEGQVYFDRHRVRGRKNVVVHVALCIIAILLVAVAALRLGVPEKARFTRVRTPAYTKNFHDVKTLV